MEKESEQLKEEQMKNALHSAFAINIQKRNVNDINYPLPLVQEALNFVEAAKRGHVALAKKDYSPEGFKDIQYYGFFRDDILGGIDSGIDDLEARNHLKQLESGLFKLLNEEHPSEEELEIIHTAAEKMANYLIEVVEKYLSPLEKRLQRA